MEFTNIATALILELDMAVLPEHSFDGRHSSLDVVPRLGEILPPTIETLILLAEHDDYAEEFTSLFAGIADDMEEKLPRLHRIFIRSRPQRLSENGSASTEEGSGEEPRWKADVRALESSVEVEFVEVIDDALPQFMERYCQRYEVEII